MAVVLIGMGMSLTACGGPSEDDAIQNVRDHAQTDYFGNMSDPELIHAMHEKCSTIKDGGMEDLSSEWVGFVFSTDVSPDEIREDYILVSGNAIKVYCPKYQKDFDNYRDGEWSDKFAAIQEGN